MKQIAPKAFFDNIHTAMKCVSLFEYAIGSDIDEKYKTLVVCSIMFAYTKLFFDININDQLECGIVYEESGHQLSRHISNMLKYDGELLLEY